MSVDRRIDPTTGDFVAGVAGGFDPVDPLHNKIALSLLLPLGSWEGDPLLGNRFHELAQAKAKATPDIVERVKDLAHASLVWLLDEGELASVDVTAERWSPEAVAVQVAATPLGRRSLTFGPFFIQVVA